MPLMKPLRFLFAAALVMAAAPLHAQTIGGRVLDRATSQPVKDAIVEVLNDRGRTVGRTRSAEQGDFVVVLKEEGNYRVRTQRIGYQPSTSTPVLVEQRQTIQVEIRISTTAVALEPLTVTARSQPPRSPRLDREGFYDRERLGFGKFLTQYEVEQTNATETTQVFRAVPGLYLIPAGGNHYNISLSRGGDNCQPRILVDNLPTRSEDLDGMLQPRDVLGIEVYRGASETPGRFQGQRSACGLIVIWTNAGERR